MSWRRREESTPHEAEICRFVNSTPPLRFLCDLVNVLERRKTLAESSAFTKRGLTCRHSFLSPCGLESTWAHQLPVTCKVSSVEIKCEVANGDFLGFELELVCFSHGVPLYGAKTSRLP